MRLLVRWLVNGVAIGVTAWLFGSHMEFSSVWSVVIAAAVLGILNTLVRPILRLITLPINILTLGLFGLIVNAAILELLAWMMGDRMVIENFWWAILAALAITVITAIINIVIGDDKKKGGRSRR